MSIKVEKLQCDVLIIGGGAAGCYSAITLGDISNKDIIVVDKANIKRSGCLAAGINAINAYLTEGETPESYVKNVIKEGEGIVREDLTYTIGQELNNVTKKLEDFGLTILKDNEGKYISRGKRSIKINGENIKPILAKQVYARKNIRVKNNVNIVDYLVKDNRVIGAIGFSIVENIIYLIYSKATICTTGGASGIYKPNNPGFSRHKLWYPPFNVGAGYAMGIRAGAEMTSFEMRFIALRCKDTIAPTGTIAQGIKAKQVNSNGEEYVNKYGKATTTTRLFATVEEGKAGSGPCYLKTVGIDKESEVELYKAYLNMAPSQALKWIENGKGPSVENVEIEGTEPYLVGGHGACGYWVNRDRATTLEGLFAGGDVVGGSPKKYATGAMVEGEIAGKSALKYIESNIPIHLTDAEVEEKINEITKFLGQKDNTYSIDHLEEAMQKTMDVYAGGISKGYVYNESSLKIAYRRVEEILKMVNDLRAKDFQELMYIYELIDRLYICKVLIKHMESRKETRWRGYGENRDYQFKDDNKYLKYINSIYRNGQVDILFKDIIKIGDIYEYKN